MKKKDWLLTALIIVAWGANFTVSKIGIRNMPTMLLAAIRYLMVAFPAIFFIKRPAVDWTTAISYAMTLGLGVASCQLYAFQIGMPAGLASVVMQSSSFITVLLAMIVFKERPRFNQTAGLLIAVSGLAIIGLTTDLAKGAAVPLAGVGLIVLAAFFWSLATLIVKAAATKAASKGVPLDMLGMVAWTALIPPIPFILLALIFDSPSVLWNAIIHINPTAILSILFLAWCSSLLGIGAWNYLLSKYSASLVAPLSMMVPAVGLFIAWIVLGEKLSLLQWIGSVVVITGLVVFNLGFRPIKALRANAAIRVAGTKKENAD